MVKCIFTTKATAQQQTRTAAFSVHLRPRTDMRRKIAQNVFPLWKLRCERTIKARRLETEGERTSFQSLLLFPLLGLSFAHIPDFLCASLLYLNTRNRLQVVDQPTFYVYIKYIVQVYRECCVCVINHKFHCTVEPPLTDTSRRRTPLVSGHLVMFSGTYKHYIFHLL